MKKRIVLFTVLLIATGFFLTTNSFAEQTFYVCTVDEVGGTSWATTFLTLSDTAATPAFTEKGFFFVESKNNEFLAVALTAVSLGYNLRILTDLTESDYPFINAIYLQQP